MLNNNFVTRRDKNDRLQEDVADANRRIANQYANLLFMSKPTTEKYAVQETADIKRALNEKAQRLVIGCVLVVFALVEMWGMWAGVWK